MAVIKIMENESPYGGMAEAPTAAYQHGATEMPELQRWTLKLGKDGRLVIPAAARALMYLGSEGKVTVYVKDGELHVISPMAALKRVQVFMKKYDKGQGSIVDELIADRRAAAAIGD